MSKPSNLLKTEDVARCLGIGKRTVYEWVARGYFPVIRFGRTIRIDARDLAQFIERTRLNTLASTEEVNAQQELLG